MDKSALIALSLEQVAETLGDPTEPVFARLAQRCPALVEYADKPETWQPYMMQEILEHLLAFHDDPALALSVLNEMAVHHQLIGLPDQVFTTFYQVLQETVAPVLSGEYRADMLAVWQETVSQIETRLAS